MISIGISLWGVVAARDGVRLTVDASPAVVLALSAALVYVSHTATSVTVSVDEQAIVATGTDPYPSVSIQLETT